MQREIGLQVDSLFPITEDSHYAVRPIWIAKGRPRSDTGLAVSRGPGYSPRLRRRAGRAARSGYRGAGSTHGRANVTPDAGTGRQSHGNPNPHSYHDGRPNQPSGPPAVTHAHSNLYSYPDANADCGTYSYSHAGSHCDPGTNPYCYTHAHPDAVAYPDADPCANGDPGTNSYGYAPAHPVSYANAYPRTNAYPSDNFWNFPSPSSVHRYTARTGV